MPPSRGAAHLTHVMRRGKSATEQRADREGFCFPRGSVQLPRTHFAVSRKKRGRTSARSRPISKRTPPVQQNAVHDTADATDQKCHEQHYRHGNVIQFWRPQRRLTSPQAEGAEITRSQAMLRWLRKLPATKPTDGKLRPWAMKNDGWAIG